MISFDCDIPYTVCVSGIRQMTKDAQVIENRKLRASIDRDLPGFLEKAKSITHIQNQPALLSNILFMGKTKIDYIHLCYRSREISHSHTFTTEEFYEVP
jgi:hypothetical protein|tara:strand:- start:1708 stop:2004 length:297 start_codon:yes stop_codon:yes gene_type:complete